MRARIVLIGVAAVAACVLQGCGGDDDGSGSDREVVASFYPLAWAAERIAGETATVTNLTPGGAEPHDLELTARDVERVRSADVVLYLGGGFQPALERTLDGAEGDTVDLLDAVDVLGTVDEHDHDGGGSTDPHVWLDPIRFAAVVDRVGEALQRPEAARRVAAEVRALDALYRERLDDCARRELVTSHAAFGYLAQRYDLRQVAITGISPEAEPTPSELEDVVAEVREHGATTVFFETLVSPRLAETVAREVGADVAVLNPLEGLTEDELDRGEDYLSVMRANLEALRKALGCR